MFKLDLQECQLANLNTRTENHGEDYMPAADLKFTTTMGNHVLDMFDDELREMLFKKKPVEQEDLADQGMEEGYLSEIRFPYLQKTVAWNYEGAGYRLEIEHGLAASKNIVLINVGLKSFKFSPKEGGSVDLEFTATGNPKGEEVGKLYELQKAYVDVTLTPPSAETRAQMELDAARGDDEEDEDEEQDKVA